MVMSDSGVFEPSEKRGTALLREVLELIETEIVHAGKALNPVTKSAGRWFQEDWGRVALDQEVRDAAAVLPGWQLFPDDPEWRTLPAAVVFESCGSTGCVAGHATLLAGDSPVVMASTLEDSPGMTVSWTQVVPIDGEKQGVVVSVDDRAQELLGLTEGQAQDLFCAGNTITDVRDAIRRIMRANLPFLTRGESSAECLDEGLVCSIDPRSLVCTECGAAEQLVVSPRDREPVQDSDRAAGGAGV